MELARKSELTGPVIGAAIEVHRHLGPGLLESVYEECLSRELRQRGFEIERQKQLPLIYKGLSLDCGFKVDIIVANELVLELKACHAIESIHVAQVLTYLKLSGIRLGLILNFNTTVLRNGIRRVVL